MELLFQITKENQGIGGLQTGLDLGEEFLYGVNVKGNGSEKVVLIEERSLFKVSFT